jgi:hypothetical protein
MNYWRINTDSEARDDSSCDIWYRLNAAFAGDHEGTKRKHDGIFLKFSPEDGVFMHQSRLGVVGYGIVQETWDRETYKGADRKFYVNEPYEYRIAVKWLPEYDCRSNPLSISGFLPYAGAYSIVDPKKWKVQKVLQALRKLASHI